jgi:hypothetical protein
MGSLMGTMQVALRGIGLRPTPQPKRITIVDVVDKMFTIKPRKIVVRPAGAFFKARFDGKRNCAFGATPEEAVERLKRDRV